MSRHFFIAPAGVVSPRWTEAFPEAVLLADPARLPALGPADVVWLSSALADWSARLHDLSLDGGGARIVVLSAQPAQQEALLALDGGALGYCHVLSTATLLREVAVVVGHGGLWIGPELMARVIGALRQAPAQRQAAGVLDLLSPREREVAEAVSAGHSNKEVARLLGITERTVKAHLGAVFEKLGVRDRLQLALRVGA
ncbi:response regulator transcription factor [Pseudothauera nasutitermitis]|uniref:Response regulator transcription factor n=1 Tax=Pseudothauera nasutitermitis TaxID=2565930 RepID=A0A4S4APG3_9RHOO|nr:response regulator transcription factor [Pseudothauera nasutitermitis]THF61147.1 response regulator transcription factor [Pseudothauera nasutitermitis]